MKANSHKIYVFRNNLFDWYNLDGRKFPWRKSASTKYQYIIAEVLLQRTRAETVANFFPDFIQKFPSWKNLSTASPEQLQEYLQPLGLWRRRASSIHLLAQEMTRRNGRFPSCRSEIEALPGIGQYIANAILMFCHSEPQPLLDVNMSRVLERVFGSRKMADIRYDPYLQNLALTVVTCKKPERMNWAILDLAATVCTIRNPHCDRCPIVKICNWKAKENR